jgi:hypothetical protein
MAATLAGGMFVAGAGGSGFGDGGEPEFDNAMESAKEL